MQFFRTLLISVLISLSCSYIIMSLMIFTSPHDVMNGQELLEEVVIAIALGIAISVLSVIFEMERIPFLGQLFLHFSGIVVCVFTAGYFGQWYDVADVSTMAIILVAIIIIYIGTWWIMQNVIQKDINEVNKTIQKRRGDAK